MMIRLAYEGDLPGILDIYNRAIVDRGQTAHLEPLDLAERRGWLAGHPADSYPAWVIEGDGAVAGWCSLGPWRAGRQALRGVAEISYFVHVDYRRQGIGRALVAHAIGAAPALGLTHLVALLLDVNSVSINLLEAFGFSRMGYIPDAARFDGRTCGHLLMGRLLSEA